jgi:hypothetical protein
MAQEDYAPLLIGAGALLILAKWGFGNIPNPLPAAGRAIAKTADELTGGLQKDRDENWTEYLFEVDVPFSDQRLPFMPGLVRDQGNIYTTEGQYTRMDIAEPDQPLGEYFLEIDLPGVPAYDVRDAPADLYRSTIGRVLR